MNRHFLYNNLLNCNDALTEKCIRKYYQKTNSNIKDLNYITNLKKQILSNELEYPEYSEVVYAINELDINLKEFFDYISKFRLEDDASCFFVTFTIYSIKGILDGVYFYDMCKNNIYMIRRFDEELQNIYENNLDFNICISMFCDIKRAAFIWNEGGLIKSTLQIGKFSQYISSYNKIALQKKDEHFNKQAYTHALGINLYNQLLIENKYMMIGSSENDSQ